MAVQGNIGMIRTLKAWVLYFILHAAPVTVYYWLTIALRQGRCQLSSCWLLRHMHFSLRWDTLCSYCGYVVRTVVHALLGKLIAACLVIWAFCRARILVLQDSFKSDVRLIPTNVKGSQLLLALGHRCDKASILVFTLHHGGGCRSHWRGVWAANCWQACRTLNIIELGIAFRPTIVGIFNAL
jgi:hypothetical protein